MHDEHPHPLLAQLPLTVSPFLSLPAATTLPYTYKSLPSTLPPSITDPTNTNTTMPPQQPPSVDPQQQETTRTPYVLSASGHAAHPDDIIASCRALQAHLNMLEQKARATVAEWEERRRAAELAEKRRVAPGWLDEEVRMLVPERAGAQQVGIGEVEMRDQQVEAREQVGRGSKEGEELDRAFGGLGLR
ncbi:uncharacterized protein BDZ99DRAFT_512811 [Mytilinidion resinicola]|uniref:Uncharacterized protein n=1 Tax=Mytilinidion resinicola TaxID=574789 RepID=A0A6A6XZ13_9PEZI|nr:uncharacterized protein BDZ99DRAFT_512811 [Mytilinidion resinicola]KAF2801742.1 hypothetical protein BDZ99DRAFT_512811 [Mytilinidion resinicola]